MTPFAEYLFNYRQKHDLTERGMANIIGVDYYTYVRWERGIEYPHRDHLKKIIAALADSAPEAYSIMDYYLMDE
jgi:transcriptional regulator with XRE-family HTH domain